MIGGLVAADQVITDLQQDKPNDAAYHALVWGSQQVIKSSLKAFGYGSVASTASLATLPISYSLLRFEEEAQRLALLNQMRLYFAARGLGLTKQQILNREEPPGAIVLYTDQGWLYVVEDLHTAWGNHPSNLTVSQTYDICEEAWRTQQVAYGYWDDKRSIGEDLLANLQGVALIRTSPAWASAPVRVTFDGTASRPKPNTSITGYEWHFWDGSVSTSPQ
ncbi:MAG: hypothetical protein ACPL7O_09420, partial [Armatimonadota bacterium]